MITIAKEVLITQGTGPYQYQWINSTSGCGVTFSNPSGTSTGTVETDVTFATNACTTTASITLQVIDALGCSNQFPITFTNPCATSPITSFSQQVDGTTVQITAVTTNQNLTYNWLFDNSIFSLTSVNGNDITLTVNNPRPNVGSSNVVVETTDTATGCSWVNTYTYTFCTPLAHNENLAMCRFNEQPGSAFVCFNVDSCTTAIDWSTLVVNTPAGFAFSQGVDNCGTISAPTSTLGGMYSATFTVNDIQGNTSNEGTLFISYAECNNGTSCIAAPGFQKEVSCEEIANLPGTYVLVDLDDLVVTNTCTIDWSTFAFTAGAGQTSTGTGVGATLTTGFGTVALNANHELVYTFTVQPTGAAEAVTWNVSSTNGNQTGNVQVLISYDCTMAPVATDDAFNITCEAPFIFHDVLANDTGTINPNTVSIMTQPTEGTVVVNTAGEIQYNPIASTEGVVTFGYTVLDYNNQVSNEATVTMTVICAGNDTTIDQCGDITVTPFDLLTGAKTISGTWVQTSVGGPAIPATYNGTMDFTGIASGTYTYEYTVTLGPLTHTSVLTFNHVDDCCTTVSLGFSVTGETLFVLAATARVRYTWDFGAGNLYNGTIAFENIAEGTITNVVLTGASSTGSTTAAFDYTPGALQDHPVVATFNLTNATTGCACTAVVNMFDIPSTVGVLLTLPFSGNC